MEINKRERSLIFFALKMHKNWLETNDPLQSAKMAMEDGDEMAVVALDPKQIALTAELNKLAARILDGYKLDFHPRRL